MIARFFEMVDILMPNWEQTPVLSDAGIMLGRVLEDRNFCITEVQRVIEQSGNDCISFHTRPIGVYFQLMSPSSHAQCWKEFAQEVQEKTKGIQLTMNIKTGEIQSVCSPTIEEFVSLLERLPNRELADRCKKLFLKNQQ